MSFHLSPIPQFQACSTLNANFCDYIACKVLRAKGMAEKRSATGKAGLITKALAGAGPVLEHDGEEQQAS
jgi:hypothetical protein